MPGIRAGLMARGNVSADGSTWGEAAGPCTVDQVMGASALDRDLLLWNPPITQLLRFRTIPETFTVVFVGEFPVLVKVLGYTGERLVSVCLLRFSHVTPIVIPRVSS